MNKFILLMLAMLALVRGAIYEARNSDDVDFFINHNPEKVEAILFYDPNQDKDEKVSSAVEKTQSIFKNIGEEGRSKEEWVNSLNDKVHLMRVDATATDNARTVDDYKVSKTPLIVVLSGDSIQFMEVVTGNTFDHVKDYFNDNPLNPQSEAEKDDAAVADAQKAAQDAKKAATEALKALEEANKAFEEHLKTHDDADKAKNATSDSDKPADDDKCPSSNAGSKQDQGNQNSQQPQGGNQNQGGNQQNQGGNQQNQGGNQQPQGGNQQPQGGNQQPQGGNQQGNNQWGQQAQPQGGAQEIEYIPVLRKIDQPNGPHYVKHGDHWHLVSN